MGLGSDGSGHEEWNGGGDGGRDSRRCQDGVEEDLDDRRMIDQLTNIRRIHWETGVERRNLVDSSWMRLNEMTSNFDHSMLLALLASLNGCVLWALQHISFITTTPSPGERPEIMTWPFSAILKLT
jgi:hypothetical protein